MCMLASAVGLLADRSFLGVFCAAMLTIGIGWGLRKKNVLKAESRTVLNSLLLKLTVPCLAFDAFMADFDRGELRRNLQILLLSFVLYLTMIALAQLIFARYGKQKANLYGLCFAIGQQTLYAMPILRAIYQSDPAEAMLSASMVAIAFRVMLYLYAFYSISGAAVTGGSLRQSLKKAFLTPVMLAMFAGFLIWLSQELLPAPGGIPLLRLDLRLPALYAVVPQMASLVNPLAMLLIGSTLGDGRLGDALRDGKAWLIAFLRMFIAPLYTLALLCLCQRAGWIHFTEVTLMTVVMCFAAPLSAVLCTFFITYRREAATAARVCLLSTLFCVVSTPLCYCLVKAVTASGVFPV